MNRRTFFKTLIIGGLATALLPEKVFCAAPLPFPFDFLSPYKYRLEEKGREVMIYSRKYNDKIVHLNAPINEIDWHEEYHGIPLWRDMRYLTEYEIEMSEGVRRSGMTRGEYFEYKQREWEKG